MKASSVKSQCHRRNCYALTYIMSVFLERHFCFPRTAGLSLSFPSVPVQSPHDLHFTPSDPSTAPPPPFSHSNLPHAIQCQLSSCSHCNMLSVVSGATCCPRSAHGFPFPLLLYKAGRIPLHLTPSQPPIPPLPPPMSPLSTPPQLLLLAFMTLQVIQEAQKWCHRVSGGTELPALLSLADAALTQFITSLQASVLQPEQRLLL